jgi:hypothetical protein
LLADKLRLAQAISREATAPEEPMDFPFWYVVFALLVGFGLGAGTMLWLLHDDIPYEDELYDPEARHARRARRAR